MAGLIDFSGEEHDDVNVTPEADEVVDQRDTGDNVSDFDGEDIIRQALLSEEDYVEEVVEGDAEGSGEETRPPLETEPPDDEDGDVDLDFKNQDNSRNAERRRQQEQRIADRLKAESPEYKLAQQMAAMSGKTVEQLAADLQEAELVQRAKQQGLPLEAMRRMSEAEQRTVQLEQKLAQFEFNAWVSRIDQEVSGLKADYPMLEDADFAEAKRYLLQDLKNPDLPLERAVFALHGKKIMDKVRDSSQNEALAQASGRKAASTPPPKASKTNETPLLTAEEKAVAEIYNMSDEEYIKWRT